MGRVAAQTQPGTACMAYQIGLQKAFLAGLSIDSIMMAHTSNEDFLTFFREADEPSRIGLALNVYLQQDTLRKKAFAEFLQGYYLNTRFPELEAKSITGERLTLPEENTITVFNTWFTACKPCLEEMPDLNRLVEKYHSVKQVRFVSVARNEKPDLEAFLQNTPFAYTTIADPQSELLEKICPPGFPTNLVLDGEGNIRFFAVGRVDMAALDAAIQNSLN